MTIIALVIGLSLTLALIFFNFSLVYTLKFFREGSVPAGRYLFMLSITAVNVGVIIWLARLLKIANRPVKEPPHQPRPNLREQHKNLILDFAEQKESFSLQDISGLTGLSPMEAGYLLDELLASGYLDVQEKAGEFHYQLA